MEGFFKVDQSGGSYVTAEFYNPTTGETRSECVRDYDYGDCSRDNDELYNMPIDKEVRTLWLHSRGQILAGDTVEVVKGRKVPRGTIATVKSIRPYRLQSACIQSYLRRIAPTPQPVRYPALGIEIESQAIRQGWFPAILPLH